MKNNKIKTVLLTLLFFLNAVSFNLYAQFPSIDHSNLYPFLAHLECEYGNQISISPKLIGQFMNNILGDQISGDCFTPTVSIMKETNVSHTFAWQSVGGANGYVAGKLGLETGEVNFRSTTLHEVTFNTTVNQLYLFAFISDCLQGQSSAEIIIVEKDIVSYNSKYDTMNDCRCSEGSPKTPLDPITYCPYFDTHFFAWNNTCFANKYRFNISDDGGYDSNFLTIVEDHGDIPKVYALSFCNFNSNPEYKSLYDFGDGTNYQAVITGEGIHFYFLNNDLINPRVEGTICDCWSTENNEKGKGREGQIAISSYEDLQINPNPFHDELQLVLPANDAPAEVLIYNLNGQLVKQQNYSLNGATSLRISTHELAAGLYQLQVRQGQKIWQRKIVKSK